MGKKVSDLVLCFSSSFAYPEATKVWPNILVPSNGRSPNVAAIRADYRD